MGLIFINPVSLGLKKISSKYETFQFIHSDIYNFAYWPAGKYDAESWLLNFNKNNFDIIIVRSLFTHMLPDELDMYIKHISKSLNNAGKVVATFFLLNDTQKKMKNNSIHFIKQNKTSVHSIMNKLAPTAAVAYEQDYILE